MGKQWKDFPVPYVGDGTRWVVARENPKGDRKWQYLTFLATDGQRKTWYFETRGQAWLIAMMLNNR